MKLFSKQESMMLSKQYFPFVFCFKNQDIKVLPKKFFLLFSTCKTSIFLAFES